ncbi:methyltransferase domain-containing protein [Pseudomaricurvus alkylphenolicus]|uniref:class I SAM-dependent DNA methyltransferase n=1 Tax=Pseudomaricurvus alkylphenolicus TaxID=1306991 RepID=UPI00141DD755|nr:class I SAM-dependent methyltransferase [Pseudomaricurvus alkylphenolicus]NIB41633.1 methyltransferase domain-containing protein [Pseudomaricurvus alkylphenolicus]
MSDTWDDYADDWDTNASVIAYADNAYQSLIAKLDIDGFRILDFGCGTGLLTEKLSRHATSIVALDPSSKMIDVLDAKRIGNVNTISSELSQSEIDENPLLGEEFELIVASSSLAFVPDFGNTLKLLKQLLKREGRLVQWDWLKQENEPGSGFSEKEIREAYERAGFSNYSVTLPFSMENGEDSIEVIMAVANNQ